MLLLRTNFFTQGVIIGFCVIAVHRGVNLLITRLRFRQWGMLHSWGNKITGLLLYMLLPVCVVVESAAVPVAISLFAAAFLSSLDETMILLCAKSYDANRKIYFITS